jgi:survival of motor neuron protein-interacting protein 1
MNEVTTTSLESEEYVNIRKRKRELAVDCGIELDEVPEADEQIAEWGSQDGDIGEEEAEEAESSYPIWEGAIGAHPTLKLLLQFDQVLTQKVLMYLVEWLDDNGIDDAGLTQKIGQWIYSLLTRVEKPLHRDTVALIRQLYRCCCVMRNKLHGNISNDILEQRLATLNTLISISGYYFGQGEYYKSFEPIIEVDTNNQQNVKNLLEDGSSDEDDEMEADDDEIQISDDDDKDANEPPKKWKATTIDV